MNKLIISTLLLIGLIGMIGTASATRVDIVPGDDSNPLYHPLDGSMMTYHTEILEISVTGIRYVELSVSPGITSARLVGTDNTVVISATPGSPNSTTWNVPAGETVENFNLEVTTSLPGEVTIITNAIGDPEQEGYQDIGAGANNFIPEFPTVALPIAAILGLMFIISSRKKKE